MDAAQVARVLDEVGTLLEVRGENPFRCRAYHAAADALRALGDELPARLAAGTLDEVPGLGEATVSKVLELARTGRLALLDELRQETPPGLRTLLRVPGLGSKKVMELHRALGVADLEDLKRAAASGRLATLKGYGPKSVAKILEGIAFVETIGGQVLQHHARRIAAGLLERLRGQRGVVAAEVAGTLRRRTETVAELVLVFAARDPEPRLDEAAAWPEVEAVVDRSPGRLVARLGEGPGLVVRGVSRDGFGPLLLDATGPDRFVAEAITHARGLGLELSAAGLSGADGPIACPDEDDLFAALALPPIAPERRERPGTVAEAAVGALPALVTLADLRGTFHCHTDWSDGGATLEEMVAAARAAGLEYLGIADHSRSAGYAGGLSIERVRQQADAIDRLNADLGGAFRVFKGIESDILSDGSLDYPDEVLAGFDYVVGSVHSQFGMPREELTARVCRAVANPRLTILGHPTGRLLLARAPYAIDLGPVIEEAARAGASIEINANPHRLDLDDAHARRARDAGVPIAINPDAHSTGEIALLEYGVAVARRAGLAARDVLNSRGADEVAAWLARRRDGSR